jgi:hypothetical protein
MTQRPMNCAQKLIVVERLDEKSEGAGRHYSSFSGRVFTSGDENHMRPGRFCTEMRQQFHPGHASHPDIQNGQRNENRGHIVEKRFRFAKGPDAQSVRFKQSTEGFSHRCVVIDETDDFRVGNLRAARFLFRCG